MVGATSATVLAEPQAPVQNEQFRKKLFFLGAVGDPAGEPGTIFDGALSKLDSFLHLSEWQAEVHADGGHPNTDSILQHLPAGVQKGPMSLLIYQQVTNQLEQTLLGENPPKQVLIYIDSHGAAKYATSTDKTHQIAVADPPQSVDLNSLHGTETISLDNLQKIVDAAQKANVKLAIVDMSCHSGNTLALANPDICVIASTAADLYAYTNFSESFLNKMRKGKDLESVYLENRIEDTKTPSLPQISTPAGQFTAQFEDTTFRQFLFYKDTETKTDKLSDLISTEASTCESCDAPANRKIQALEKWASALGANALKDPDYLELRTSLQKVQELQSRYEAEVQKLGLPLLQTPVTIDTKFVDPSGVTLADSSKTDYATLLAADLEGQRAYFIRQIVAEKNRVDNLHYQLQLQNIENSILKRQEILTQHPQLREAKKAFEAIMDQSTGTYALAVAIVQAERKLYQKVYLQQKAQRKGRNACQDFVL